MALIFEGTKKSFTCLASLLVLMLYEAFMPRRQIPQSSKGFFCVFFTVHAKFCACVHTFDNLEPRIDSALSVLFGMTMALT